ncbi:DNA polymerase V [Bacilli bacterium PM5-3]|nr:DNA polymerase V [Bacilli bacterium PM5-3]
MEQLEKFKLYDNILCIDLKCFFASVECIDLKKNPFTYDLVVADKSRGKSSIVLAVSPSLKKKGIPGRCRIFDLPKNLNIDIIKPRMARYIEISNQILKMYLKYFASNDILVYSIDEVFIDITSYRNFYKKNAYEIACLLLNELKQIFGLTAACGIGHNMLLAKLALDIEAKHNPDNIATWTYDDLPTKLWPITNLNEVWGIGRGLSKRLKLLGINSMYDLAHYDIYKLVKEFGMMGEEIFLHAHGIDVSKIQEQDNTTKRKGYNVNHTLFKNTPKNQVRQLVKELVVQLAHRLRTDNKATSVIQLYIGYASNEEQPSFRMQKKLETPTIDLATLSNIVMNIFDKEVLDISIRRIGLSFSKLSEFEGVQLNIFEQEHEIDNINLDFAYDMVNIKYGQNTVFKASALSEDSQFFKRSKLIGGHNAK